MTGQMFVDYCPLPKQLCIVERGMTEVRVINRSPHSHILDPHPFDVIEYQEYWVPLKPVSIYDVDTRQALVTAYYGWDEYTQTVYMTRPTHVVSEPHRLARWGVSN